MLALFAHFFAGRAGARRASGFAHDGIGDAVGFLLFGVIGIADGELGLKKPGAKELPHGLVTGELLQLQGRRKRRGGGRSSAAVARYGGTRLVLLGGFGDAFHEGNSRSERNDAAACAFTMARAADCNTREIRSATAACLVFAIRARCRG